MTAIATANLGPNMPGLAQSTASRVDSSSKHIVACRVAEHFMLDWCKAQAGSDKRRELHVNKNKYCMFKNELVLNVSQPLYPMTSTRQYNETKAYPNVITTMADCDIKVFNWLRKLYTSRTATKWMEYWGYATDDTIMNDENQINNVFGFTKGNPDFLVGPNDKTDFKKLVKNMPLFMAQGYALGTAWASQQTGDTVASVLIGGMQTVMNGAFACSAGDVLQWYFDFEELEFADKTKNITVEKVAVGGRAEQVTVLAGQRLPYAITNDPILNDYNNTPIENFHGMEGPMVKRRRAFHERMDGVLEGGQFGMKIGPIELDSGGNLKRTGCGKAFPKPYRMAIVRNSMNQIEYTDHYGDRIRIFAKCISSARPHEMVDVMLMTQSL